MQHKGLAEQFFATTDHNNDTIGSCRCGQAVRLHIDIRITITPLQEGKNLFKVLNIVLEPVD